MTITLSSERPDTEVDLVPDNTDLCGINLQTFVDQQVGEACITFRHFLSLTPSSDEERRWKIFTPLKVMHGSILVAVKCALAVHLSNRLAIKLQIQT